MKQNGGASRQYVDHMVFDVMLIKLSMNNQQNRLLLMSVIDVPRGL